MNVYVPPVNSMSVDFDLADRLPCMDVGKWIVCGDWIAHNACWYPFVESDTRGARLLDWCDDLGLHVVNDGSGTREDRGTGRMSVPDVSCGSLSDACDWSVHTGFTSDHLPDVIQFGDSVSAVASTFRMMWD